MTYAMSQNALEGIVGEFVEAEPWFARVLYWRGSLRLWGDDVRVEYDGQTFDVHYTLDDDCTVDVVEIRAEKDHQLLFTYRP